MTVREIIQSLENENKQLKEENNQLKKSIRLLLSEKRKIKYELNLLKEHRGKEIIEEPVVEEIETQVTSIVANVDGKVKASIVEGGKISIDDVLPEKPKRSRKKKVEPVEEQENEEGLER